MVSLPLPELLAGLPDALRAGVMRQPAADALISLPLSMILQQVTTGTVKVPFGQLRMACPGGVFLDAPAHDQTVVTLPLALILPRINPANLARRSGQRRMVDPGAFEAVFAKVGQPESSYAAAALAPVGTQGISVEAPSRPVPEVQPDVAKPFPSTTPTPAAPAPIPMSTALPFLSPAKAVPAPNVAPQPIRPLASSAPAAPLPGTWSRPVVMTPSPAQMALVETVWVPMNLLSTHWPADLQTVLVKPVFSAGRIGLPVSELESGLRLGKLVFSWKQLRDWIEPTPPAGGMAEDMLVPLPLQAIVPLFLARRSVGIPAQHKEVVLDHSIPDVFSASSSGKTAAVANHASTDAARPVPAASPIPPQIKPQPPVVPPTVEPAVSPVPQEFEILFGQPGKTSWTPAEIVAKTVSLPGIVGSLVSLQDGLLVSGRVPKGIDAETVAAFLPQVFGRLAYYTRELKFGEPSYAGLVMAEYSLHIYKTGKVYFLALGRAGEQAPLVQLSVIAAQLERQSKSN